jgi:hypothetical protein
MPMVNHASDDLLGMVSCISEVVAEIIKRHKRGKNIDVDKIKKNIAAAHKLNRAPKLVDIIAAIPEEYRKSLLPIIQAKPIRSASGIAVVAVMSKPHRCPHIALTGSICVYCFTQEHQLLTRDRGWVFIDAVHSSDHVATYNHCLKSLEYQQVETVINEEVENRAMIEVGQETQSFSWAPESNAYGYNPNLAANHENNYVGAVTTADHDWFVQKIDGNSVEQPYAKVKGFELINNSSADQQFNVPCLAENGIHHAIDSSAVPLPFMTALNLSTEQHKAAFLKIYGFWLGAGYLEVRGNGSAVALIFKQLKAGDIEFISAELGKLNVGFDQILCDNGESQIRIADPIWVSYFGQEYSNSNSKNTNSTQSCSGDSAILCIADAKSVHWFWGWVFSRLNKAEIRLILEGLSRSAGDSHKQPQNRIIYTSGAKFRDSLIALCLHAGYWANFVLRQEKGREGEASSAQQGAVNIWAVSYGEKLGKTATFSSLRDVKSFNYSGRVYCVSIPNGLLFARRAQHPGSQAGPQGIINKATKPFIIGNCPGGPDSDFEYSTQAYTGWVYNKYAGELEESWAKLEGFILTSARNCYSFFC